MAPTQKPDNYLNLGSIPQFTTSQSLSTSSTAETSPIESHATPSSMRLPFGNGSAFPSLNNSTSRLGSSSPIHEYGTRLFTKRAREIQAQEGVHPAWCPPASGLSTPLRETIPESPDGEGFPDFNPTVAEAITGQSSAPGLPTPSAIRGRTRAGTLPSRLPPAPSASVLSNSLLSAKSSRPTPSSSPFRPGLSNSQTPSDVSTFPTLSAANKFSSLSSMSSLNRLRAGSMPQRPGYSSNPFGPSIFSTSYGSSLRERSTTLASIRSQDDPSSPAQSHFSRDSLADTDVKTLDYLGLVDTPQPTRSSIYGDGGYSSIGLQPAALAELLNRQNQMANRFRSYSVNNKDRYDDEDDEDAAQAGYYSGAMTPSDAERAAQLQESIRLHNLEVQNHLSAMSRIGRPRAQTAGVLDSPSSRTLRGGFMPTSSRLDSSMSAVDYLNDADYSGLAEAVHRMKLNGAFGGDGLGDDHNSADAPTRALWLGNIPSSTTVSSLDAIFQHFGPIESTRVLTHKNCGFVNFESLESAVLARSKLNGKEIFPGAGPVRIGFAKVPSANATPGGNGIHPSQSPDPSGKVVTNGSPVRDANTAAVQPIPTVSAEEALAALHTPELSEIKDDIVAIVRELGATDDEQARIAAAVDVAISYNNYVSEVPAVPEPTHNRVHDAPRLRDIRKRIDNSTCSPAEIEEVALGMLPEIAELASDYLGNTVVQKLFEHASEPTKQAMLVQIAPHLAEIGVHKNGTWAAQKIIDVSRSPELMQMVITSLRPYSMALFLDQFGNYVMQGCLRYAFPMNNFIFDVMLGRLWDLAQGRFGSRAMRACLESHYASKDQQRMVAATIALHSVQLATNANGALLLTWFLDTCTFPRRRSVLAPRLVPHLVHLCTHKVAYLTVLKIINQRNEPEARDVILRALFFSENDSILETILRDQACGATLIFKILTTPFFDEQIRGDVVANVKNVLVRIKAQPQQGYKRLMDEVGLSTRSGGGAGGRDSHREDRPASRHSNMNGHHRDESPMSQRGGYYAAASSFNPGPDMQRSGSMDSSTGYDQYPMAMNNMTSSPYAAAPGMPLPAPLTQQQIQYQQAMMASAARGASFTPFQMGVNGMNGFPASNGMDPYRNMTPPSGGPGVNSNQMMMAQAGYGQMPAFAAAPMYGYPPMYMGAPHQQQKMGQVGAGRRGRR